MLRAYGSLLLGFLMSSTGACQEPVSMERLKGEIRRRFPTVDQVAVGELRRTLEEGEGEVPLLLDVRDPEEYAVSHLPGAQLVPDLQSALAVLEGEAKDRPMVVYCSVGYRSSSLAEELQAEGFTAIRNLEGSIFEWANAGYPLFRDGRPVEKVHPYNGRWGRYLDPELRAP